MVTHPYRTHHCGELRHAHVGQTVRLSGWVHRKRDHGQLLFIDIRDHYGLTQCVITSEQPFLDNATHVSHESVVTVDGTVVRRSPETENASLPTGMIEVQVEGFRLESPAAMLPMQVNSDQEFPEETRLTYRFLDLRREALHRNIVLRSHVIAALRKQMQAQGFLEIQTPILTASSPEGARDFLVPSRLYPGKFYALPQAPQQFKQLLMMSGFDRYFQIAPCFRDEDARADRSPGEFYQLDMEMAFATQEDVFSAIEPVMVSVFTEFSQNKTVTAAPFPRIPYEDAMLHYGCDKPDLRNPIRIQDVTDLFEGGDFTLFRTAIAEGKIVRAIPAPKAASQPRSFFDGMIGFAQSHGAGGLAYIQFHDEGAKGPIAKFMNATQLETLQQRCDVGPGDAVFFACDHRPAAVKLASLVRTHLGKALDLIDANRFAFCWVTDFPFYEWNDERDCLDFSHNPFSMPQGGLEALQKATTKEELLALKAYQYDIVCNGIELSSGAIRNHKPELMIEAFARVGYSAEQVEEKFGGMLRAFRFGAPPHGGVAPGVDRIVMLLADEPNIREIIAFPMNQQAQDLLMNAPASVTEAQLRELGIQLRPKPVRAKG